VARAPRGTAVLAFGDDRTDEDMFARLPRRAWTVRVGSGATAARFRVRGPAAVVGLLRLLLDRLSLPTTPG
jgi:trehalose 6-phosphate synthase/phosphatase